MTVIEYKALSIEENIKKKKKKIEEEINKKIEELGEKTLFRDACEYAMTNGGKRFRPALVLLIAEELGKGYDVSQAALAVEFFHTASLVVDDLPCLDDDDERREKPSLHKKYGEALALLVSYALIAAGYECIAKNVKKRKESKCEEAIISDTLGILALENATKNTGILGATGGQFLDVFTSDFSMESIRDIFFKKTGSLFEIAFVFGWLFGGGEFEKLETVKKAAYHFGMAFQIADDFGDVEKDKQSGKKANIVNLFGKEKAKEQLQEEKKEYCFCLKTLGFENSVLNKLILLLDENEKS